MWFRFLGDILFQIFLVGFSITLLRTGSGYVGRLHLARTRTLATPKCKVASSDGHPKQTCGHRSSTVASEVRGLYISNHPSVLASHSFDCRSELLLYSRPMSYYSRPFSQVFTNVKNSAMSFTLLSQTRQCHLHGGVQLSGVIDTAESDSVVSFAWRSPAQWCQ